MLKVHGSCNCRQITYEAEVAPATASLCNCTDCQMLTGSACRISVQAPASTFRLLSGQLHSYIKTADSGNKRVHSFCPNCGTPVQARANVDNPPSCSLRIGCLAEKAQLVPQRRI